MKTVILSGGRGTRMAPYTSVLPKPLLPIGEQAILEIVVERLREAGFTDITLSVGYLAHLIRAVMDNARTDGVSIEYVHETRPLGTAAPLGLIEGLDDTFLVMNGDVLTTLDFRKLVDFHRARGYQITIAVHERKTRLDYGVIEAEESGRLLGFSEKPEVTSMVSMGVYVMEPDVLAAIPARRAVRLPRPRARTACRRGRRSASTATPATGATSDATRTTRRRTRSGTRRTCRASTSTRFRSGSRPARLRGARG